jgi:site-specific DNA-methyltransferase (adenine-specific)
MAEPPIKKKRKNPYIAGRAALEFKVPYDWEIEEARTLYNEAKFKIDADRISYEDCISGMEKLPEECVDLIIADPPFGIEFDGQGSQYNRDSDLVIGGYQEVTEAYDKFTDEWLSRLPRIMKETASAFIFSGWTNLKDVLNAIEKTQLNLINHIIWKYQFGVFTKKKFVTSHYHILFVVKNPEQYFFNKIEHYPLDIWDIPRNYQPAQQKNSTKLPEHVVMKCINFCSKPGDLVFDPFLGNGTTAVCAKGLFRHFLGFEINSQLAAILEENIAKMNIGALYKAYRTFLPTKKELLEKYPHLKKSEAKTADGKNSPKQKELEFKLNLTPHPGSS